MVVSACVLIMLDPHLCVYMLLNLCGVNANVIIIDDKFDSLVNAISTAVIVYMFSDVKLTSRFAVAATTSFRWRRSPNPSHSCVAALQRGSVAWCR